MAEAKLVVLSDTAGVFTYLLQIALSVLWSFDAPEGRERERAGKVGEPKFTTPLVRSNLFSFEFQKFFKFNQTNTQMGHPIINKHSPKLI